MADGTTIEGQFEDDSKHGMFRVVSPFGETSICKFDQNIFMVPSETEALTYEALNSCDIHVECSGYEMC